MNTKLFRLGSFLCGLCLNTLFAPSAFGHLGMRLDDLKETDLFTWFHLEQVNTEPDAHQREGYRTFLGQRQSYRGSFSRCTLKLENFRSEGIELLRILVQGQACGKKLSV